MALPIIAGVVGIMLLLFALFMWRYIRTQDSRRQYLLSLGYTLLGSDYTVVLNRFTPFYPKQQHLELRNAFQRSVPGGQAILFDLVDTSDPEGNWLGEDMLAIVSPALQMPRLKFQPRFVERSEVFLNNVTERLVDWNASDRGWVRFSFPEQPTFEGRFIVFGHNEAEIRRFLSPTRLAQLARLDRPYAIEAVGDMFMISLHSGYTKGDIFTNNKERVLETHYQTMTWEQDIERRLADAQKLLAWFQDFPS